MTSLNCQITRITDLPHHHFFGYYDVCPWSPDETKLLFTEAKFIDRHPEQSDKLSLGYVNTNSNETVFFAETSAWNWQEGCRLQWLPNSNNSVIYNNHSDGQIVSVIHNIASGERLKLKKPIYAVHPSGKSALSFNFARLLFTRPGYGYTNNDNTTNMRKAPDDDGIFLLDLEAGESKLVITLAQMYDIGTVHPSAEDISYFQHIFYSPSGERFVFLHRWFSPGAEWFYTRMLTAKADGSDVRCIAEGYRISHFTWLNNESLMAWFYHPQGTGFYRITALGGDVKPVGQKHLTINGHCNAMANTNWVITDTYGEGPNLEKKLLLYNVANDICIEVSRLTSMAPPVRPLRCDFHPRWNRRGNQICIDSTHEGSRQMYLIDLTTAIEQ